MWSSEPFVSILIPLFNGIEYLEECLKSIQAQTYQDWEVIVGINGHGETGEEVASHVLDILVKLGADPRIRMIVQGTHICGKVQSLNALLEEVKAPWVALLDCDDLWLPTKLATQINALYAPATEASIIGTGCIYFGWHQGSPQIPIGWIGSQDILKANPIINSSALIRTDVCKRLQWRYPNMYDNLMEDYDFWMRAERDGCKLWNIGELLVLHRIHPTSAFNTRLQNPDALQAAYRQSLEKHKDSKDLES